MTTTSTPSVGVVAPGVPAAAPPAIPVTGDGPVDGAMALLATLPADGGARDGQVLAEVHDVLQRRLRATTG